MNSIALDNDDVAVNFTGMLALFHNDRYGTNLKKEDFYTTVYEKVFKVSTEEKIHIMDEFYTTDYFKKITPEPYSLEAFILLKKMGFNLFLVTGRKYSLIEKTKNDTENFFPNVFSSIHHANTYGASGPKKSKSEICNELGLRLIVDDDPLHIKDCASAGMKVFIYDQPWNQGNFEGDCVRFFGWRDFIHRV
ncbi:MAG: hypothetical protein WCX46_01455 [Candidatus Paceibacterota bacterium]